MPTSIRKTKKLSTTKERGYVKKTKTPRHIGKTKAVRSIQEGFEDVRSDNPRSEKNHFRKVAKQREAIKDYYERQKLLKEMRTEAARKGDLKFDERGVEMGLAMGRKHKHKTRRKRSRHKRSRHKRSRHKSHRRRSHTRRR